MTTDTAALPIEPVGEARVIRKRWSVATRIGFRFAFCYWLLYCLPTLGRVSLAGSVPEGNYISRPFLWLWLALLPWLARHVFHLSGMRASFFMTGSGDTTLDYIQNLLFVVVAVAATVAWTALDRRRGEYRNLHGWLRILLRFTLAVTLFSYGFSKIIPLQFQTPDAMRLTETYGASSPMGLLWTFMGASMPYTIFAGLAEAFVGVLLLFRRTALLGALVAVGVLLNIAMLNFCYDVPVKLYSTNLLLMALFLAVPDISCLLNVFVLNRQAPAAESTMPHFSKRWIRITINVVVLVWFVSFSAVALRGRWMSRRSVEAGSNSPIAGGFDVKDVQINGTPADWKQCFAGTHYWMVRKADGTASYFWPVYSPHSVELQTNEPQDSLKLTYLWEGTNDLVLMGKLGDEDVIAHLKRIDESKFLLTHRGFHWISEYPFNR